MITRKWSARGTKSHGKSCEELPPIDWLDPKHSNVDNAMYRLLGYALANGFKLPYRIEVRDSSGTPIFGVTKIFKRSGRLVHKVVDQSNRAGSLPITFILFDAQGWQHRIVLSEEEIEQMNKLVKDPKAHQKVLLFHILTRRALSSGIALIFAWERMKDPLGGKCEVQYQSFGFPEAFCACIYCGRSLLSSKDDKEFAQSHAHRECRDDARVDWEEPTYLPENKNRPPLIFYRDTCPGSIDNAIARVAWGIGMHYWLSRRPAAPFKILDTEAHYYGRALVDDFWDGQEELAKGASSRRE